MKKLIIDELNENQRIDKYLKKVLKNAPSALIYKMLRKKDVKVNGKRVKENYIVHQGDIVDLFLYDDKFNEYAGIRTVKKVPITFETVYEDEHILIVNKPAGLLVQGTDKNDDNLAKQVLYYLYQEKSYDPQKDYGFTPAPIHRLDRNTSGLVMIGKDLKASQDLSEMMRKRKAIEKKYLTIVYGKMENDRLICYAKQDDRTYRMILTDQADPHALKMATNVHVIKANEHYSLLEVSLITGRKHQIRFSLAAAHHPVIGDDKYGDININKMFKEKYHLHAQLLHAYSLSFNEPIGSLSYLKGKVIKAKVPAQFRLIKDNLKL